MGQQLIFVVETNKKCNSDWIYIKDTIEHFYQYDRAHTKFSTVYMNGKGNYPNKSKKIQSLISQYASTSENNRSHVLYCFDCDDYDCNPEDIQFLKSAKRYCNDREYDLIWFCKDIEQVYLGSRIANTQKKEKAATFKAKKSITQIQTDLLLYSSYRIGTSNILCVLDNYLMRKKTT